MNLRLMRMDSRGAKQNKKRRKERNLSHTIDHIRYILFDILNPLNDDILCFKIDFHGGPPLRQPAFSANRYYCAIRAVACEHRTIINLTSGKMVTQIYTMCACANAHACELT